MNWTSTLPRHCRYQQLQRTTTAAKAALFVVSFLSFLPSFSDAAAAVCPTIGSTNISVPVDTSAFDNYRFLEISGLTISRTQTSRLSGGPILYAVGDGGVGPRFGVWDGATGIRLRVLLLGPNITNFDWESMAMGPCYEDSLESNDADCLYIGETGDNEARGNGLEAGETTGRTNSTPYRILKFREPVWSDYRDGDVLPVLDVLEFNYNHPSSPSPYADCEALFMDGTDLYLVPKWNYVKSTTNNRLFRIPMSAWDLEGVYSPEPLGGVGGLMNQQWTRADLSPDRTVLALGTEEEIHFFLRCPGMTMEEAVSAEPCLIQESPYRAQLETFAWTADGQHTLQIAEGSQQPMGWTTMIFDPDTTSLACSATATWPPFNANMDSVETMISTTILPTTTAPTTDEVSSEYPTTFNATAADDTFVPTTYDVTEIESSSNDDMTRSEQIATGQSSETLEATALSDDPTGIYDDIMDTISPTPAATKTTITLSTAPRSNPPTLRPTASKPDDDTSSSTSFHARHAVPLFIVVVLSILTLWV